MIWDYYMRLKNKPWARPFLSEHPELVLDEIKFFEHLKNEQGPKRLEVGSGKGNFLLQLGLNEPKTIFYGIERALVATAICGRKLVENPRDNVVFVNADFSKMVALIPDGSFEAIYLNFSDPWPKKRHQKRRLTAPSYLAHYLRILCPGGHLYFKTDNRDLYQYSNLVMREHAYNIIRQSEDYRVLEPGDALTEYEQAFRAQGLPIYRIVVRKD